MKKIAVISAILEEPATIQNQFNEVVAGFQKEKCEHKMGGAYVYRQSLH